MHTSFIKSITLQLWQISILLLFILLSSKLTYSQNRYTRMVDSADVYSESDPKKCIVMLKKIPDPTNSLKGNLSYYYECLAFAYYHDDNIGLAYRNMLIAVKQAEKEKKYEVAGGLYIELFTLHRQIEDEPDEEFLEKAERNFVRINDVNGQLRVIQARIYSLYMDEKFEECIQSGLENRWKFKESGTEYIQLLNEYLIASSYIISGDIENGLNSYDAVQSYQGKPEINENDFRFFITALNTDLAKYYYTQSDIPSAILFLEQVAANKSILDYTMERGYYRLGCDIYKLAKDADKTSAYFDSLIAFDQKMNEMSLKQAIKSNKELVSTDEHLRSARQNTQLFVLGLITFMLIAFDLFLLVYYYRKQIKSGEKAIETKNEEIFLSLKKEQKLSTKINELEGYLANIKTEVKNISNEDEHNEQRNKLIELYKDINLKSNIIQDENALPLTNEVNADFFIKLRGFHPSLNDSELAICYYLFLGFKNKEIAIFRNATVRSIESKRFRLVKKLDLSDKQLNLVEYLNELMRSE